MSDLGEEILSWYSGKGRANAICALIVIRASVEQGFWIKGASRSASAALAKANIAAKVRKTYPEIYANYAHPLYAAHVDMYFGAFTRAPQRLAELDAIDTSAFGARDLEAHRTARQWAADFAGIAAAVEMLDARRPIPVIVCKTLSPSVVANLALQLGLKLDSVEVPPTRGEWRAVTRPIKGGRRLETVEVWFSWIEWPAGTLHNRSRHSEDSAAGNTLCHACGHAIKDWRNWVPLVARETDGTPSALWVGHDCARKLLECDISAGEICYAERATPDTNTAASS